MYEVILNSNTNGNNPNQEVPMYQTEYLDDEPQYAWFTPNDMAYKMGR